MSLHQVVLVGGPRDGQVKRVYDKPPTLKFGSAKSPDDPNGIWSYYSLQSEGGDLLVYVHVGDQHGPLSYAYGQIDLWLLSQFTDGYIGYAADVGAWDGVMDSNTHLLERQGWDVLCVEPNPTIHERLKKFRHRIAPAAAGSVNKDGVLHVHEDSEPAFTSISPSPEIQKFCELGTNWRTVDVQIRTLDAMLEGHGFPRLDVLSIDTEGTELDVLKGCDLLRWHPKAIVCESWQEVGDTLAYLRDQGYVRVERRGVNDLYLHE